MTELDDLLAESVAAIDDLDLLLAESLEQRDQKDRVAAARKQLLKGGPVEELEGCRELIREWEDKELFKSQRHIYIMEEQVCAHCGSRSYKYVQHLVYQTHRSDPHQTRYKDLSEVSSFEASRPDFMALPKEVASRRRVVPMCSLACAHSQGIVGSELKDWPH